VMQSTQKPKKLVTNLKNLSFRGQVYRPRNLFLLYSATADSSRDNAALRNDKFLFGFPWCTFASLGVKDFL
jgi:hypothetical protein